MGESGDDREWESVWMIANGRGMIQASGDDSEWERVGMIANGREWDECEWEREEPVGMNASGRGTSQWG